MTNVLSTVSDTAPMRPSAMKAFLLVAFPYLFFQLCFHIVLISLVAGAS